MKRIVSLERVLQFEGAQLDGREERLQVSVMLLLELVVGSGFVMRLES